MAEIDINDPLLAPFALQHDFRERFAHALQEIVAADERGADRHELVAIAKDALDPASIEQWLKDGRPLPWLDAIVGEDAQELTMRVMDLMSQGLRKPSATFGQ